MRWKNFIRGGALANYGLPLVLGLVLLWLSSGSVNPYASTYPLPIVDPTCGYLYNPDHEGFRAPFLLLDGAPAQDWIQSENLKRLLYPFIAYPLMKLLGFEWGGFMMNLVLFVVSFAVLSQLLTRTSGPAAASMGRWLFATFPGLAYWAGLPYSYACVVPFSVFALDLFTGIAYQEQRWARTLRAAFYVGLLCLAYDLFLPIFLVALLVEAVVLRWRVWILLSAAAVMILPTVLLNSGLLLFLKVDPLNPNTGRYFKILAAYLNPPAFSSWFLIQKDLPWILIHNFLSCGFLFLPFVAFVVAAYLYLLGRRIRLERSKELKLAEMAIIVGLGAMFILINAAPPYIDRFQIRGPQYARLYVPLGVVIISYLSSIYQSLGQNLRLKRGVSLLCGIAVIGNCLVITGPYYAPQISDLVYSSFYGHGPTGTMTKNLLLFGPHPLGVCRPPPNIEGSSEFFSDGLGSVGR